MIRLNLSTEPQWLTLAPDLRILVAPLTTALMVAARSDPALGELPETASPEELAVAMAKAVARRAVLDWEGVGDTKGNLLPVSPEGIGALLDLWPVFEAFQVAYVAKGLLLDAEKTSPRPRRLEFRRGRAVLCGLCGILPRLSRRAEPAADLGGCPGLGPRWPPRRTAPCRQRGRWCCDQWLWCARRHRLGHGRRPVPCRGAGRAAPRRGRTPARDRGSDGAPLKPTDRRRWRWLILFLSPSSWSSRPMAEKRVSVRLVAVGGRQVRAELEGVGTAGARGFGRLSTEMDLANARLAAFARRASIAMAALTAAAAAAGVAMVRSGLDTIGAQADLAASLGTTVESLQVLTWAGELAGVSLGEIEQATKKLTTRLSEAAAGSGTAVGALGRLGLTAEGLQALPLDDRLIAIQEALTRMVPAAERAGVAADLFGDRAALALLRIDPATLREAAVDIRDFGVAVSAADAAQIERTGDALAQLQLIGLGLTNRLTAAVAPALEATANALADIARGTGPLGRALDGLIANLGRLGSYAATFATLMAGRWVAAMAAAALSVRGLATALVVLRGALIRTGIGALVVGAGELVYQFTRLAAGAGGVGEAFRLLGALGREVWDRMGLGLKVTLAQMSGDWEGLKAAGLSALDGTIAGVVSFGDRTAAVFKGAYDAAVAIWGRLPGAIGDFAFQAANGLIGGIEAMLNGVVSRINGFIAALNGALDLLPDWAVGSGGVRIGTLDPLTLGRITNPFAGGATAAGTAAADAFAAALAGTYLAAPDTGLGAAADAARSRAEGYREAAGMLVDAAARPLASWQALRDAMAGAGSDADVALDAGTDATAALGDELDAAATAGRGAGAAAREAGDAATEGAEVALSGWQAVTAALVDYASKARDIGVDVGQALVGAFSSAEQAVGDFVRTGKLGMRDLVTSVIADLAQLAARQFVLGPISGALAGALGGGSLLGVAGSLLAPVLHDGGMVGAAGPGRMVPSLAFAGAPRMHSGGWAGGWPGLAPDEVPAILQRGERVLSRRELAAGGARGGGAEPVVAVTINARDAESFRQSRTQVAADIARAIARGRRGM